MKKINDGSLFFLKLFVILFIVCTSGSKSIPVQAANSNDPITDTLPSCPFFGSIISTTVVWESGCVHVITSNITITDTGSLTINPGTIVKFGGKVYLDIFGLLLLPETITPGQEVIFTSLRDDTYGGDTNGDGSNTSPARSDWDRIYLQNSNIKIQNSIIRYSDYGLTIWNATTHDFNPQISHNTFEENNFGIYLVIASNFDITSKILNNVFTKNNYGLGTYQQPDVTGTSFPELATNDFNNNHVLPIFLGGSAFPTYIGNTNTFIGYPTASQRLGIGLGGHFSDSGTWVTVANMPYVVLTNTFINLNKTIVIPEKTIIKFGLGTCMEVFGTLAIQSNQVGKETIFTSLKDDVGGDTNGDGIDSEPLPGDWLSIYLDNDTTSVNYSIFKYAQAGLTIYNYAAATFNVNITNNNFSHNKIGLTYLTTSTGSIQGQLTSNSFTENSEYPILLNGTAYPTYLNNIFIDNTHKAIAITGIWNSSGTWPDVMGESGQVFPYVVVNYGQKGITTRPGTAITIPANAVFKFDTGTYLEIQGALILGSSAQTPVIFTSFKDDTYKGDTNADSGASEPAPADWDTIYLETSETNFQYAVVKYGLSGVSVWNMNGADILPPILDSTISKNTYGIRLQICSNWNITSQIQRNLISDNQFGIYTGQCTNVTGTARPDINFNNFSKNTRLPIYLGGSAFPNYNGNNFIGYPTASQRLGIGLSGTFFGSGTWTIINSMPYVVLDHTVIASGNIVTLPAGLIIKFDTGKFLYTAGALNMENTSIAPGRFTSFKDDTGGDTNGDGNATLPAQSDWETIYLDNSLTDFHDAIVTYAVKGVTIYNQSTLAISSTIQNNRFEQNKFGAFLDIRNSGDINTAILNNVFSKNVYGLGTFSFANSNFGPYSISGKARPNLDSNIFSESSGFPLYYNGTTEPVYNHNNFQKSLHPAIAVSGYWVKDVTWIKLNGDNDQVFPYVVYENDLVQDYGATLSLPSNLVVKLDRDRSIYIYGRLNLQSTDRTIDPIIFTSYYDDSISGDTNADGGAISPDRSDWKTVWLIDTPTKTNQVKHIIARYATAAIGVYYSGPANTAVNTSIDDSLFENNHVGAVLVVGGAGDILSSINNNPNRTVFKDNNFGLATYAFSQSTGSINPTLTNIDFINNKIYPLYLGGTTFLDVQQGNTISSNASANEAASPTQMNDSQKSILLQFPDASSIQTMRQDIENSVRLPTNHLTPANNFSSGQFTINATSSSMGLGGYYNQIGTLFQQDNLPYVVDGNFPLYIYVNGVVDPVSPDLLIGNVNPQTSITMLPGTVIKFSSDHFANVQGKLDLQGTQSKPVIFTSIKDDSIGGDTNNDGGKTIPAKSDWRGIYLQSSSTIFSNAVLKYSNIGLNIYFSGAVNTNINPEVNASIFTNNVTGLTFSVVSNGDILSDIHHNLFIDNGTDISGYSQNLIGRVMVNIHDNDLLGITSFGINNLSNNWTIQAQNNYWGDSSGPMHNTNPNGKGVKVSDYVLFKPYRSVPNFTLKYSISGRITNNASIPVGISGVSVELSNGLTTTTNSGGYYIFNNLPTGNYGITPILSGYRFTPSSFAVNIPGDATAPTMIGTLSTQTTFTISGKVREFWGMPVNGVIIQLDNGASTATGSDGKYKFLNILAGTYKILPSFNNYVFGPTSRTVTIGPEAQSQDFMVNAVIGTYNLFFMAQVRK